MTITAKIICDSIGAGSGSRITTLQLCYPRFIHAEFMTHRVFSRNASSSRAIPVAKMIEAVRTNPAMPIHWGKNEAGMQASAEFDEKGKNDAICAWKTAAMCAANVAETMAEFGLHKQVVNRILEPFQHIHVVVTATEWSNFFALRCHPAAQPEIQALANAIRDAMNESTPFSMLTMDWHMPYVNWRLSCGRQRFFSDFKGYPTEIGLDVALKCSAARCARVSYLKHEGGTPSIEDDLTLYDRLVGSDPIHASPVEHQARPDTWEDGSELGDWQNHSLHGNFVGWIQRRKEIERSAA